MKQRNWLSREERELYGASLHQLHAGPAELTNLIGSGNPNRDALQYIDPEIAKNPAVFPGRATGASGLKSN